MEDGWSPNTIKGALQARVVALILDYDEDLLRRLIEVRGSSRDDTSQWADLTPERSALFEICLIILNKNRGVTASDLFRHLRWEDWDRLLHALCLFFEVDPAEWQE